MKELQHTTPICLSAWINLTREIRHKCVFQAQHKYTNKCTTVQLFMHVNKVLQKKYICTYKHKFSWPCVEKTDTKHMKTLYNKKLPRLIHLSAPKFLYPYLTHKSTNASSVLDKELHFSPSEFFLQAAGITSEDETLCSPQPQRRVLFGTVCQSGKSTPCSVPSAHIITQLSHSPITSTPKKRL